MKHEDGVERGYHESLKELTAHIGKFLLQHYGEAQIDYIISRMVVHENNILIAIGINSVEEDHAVKRPTSGASSEAIARLFASEGRMGFTVVEWALRSMCGYEGYKPVTVADKLIQESPGYQRATQMDEELFRAIREVVRNM